MSTLVTDALKGKSIPGMEVTGKESLEPGHVTWSILLSQSTPQEQLDEILKKLKKVEEETDYEVKKFWNSVEVLASKSPYDSNKASMRVISLSEEIRKEDKIAIFDLPAPQSGPVYKALDLLFNKTAIGENYVECLQEEEGMSEKAARAYVLKNSPTLFYKL